MSAFEHLSVLISIIIGLGITQLLTDTQRLVQFRGPLKTFWLSFFWSIVVFIAMVEWWWASFGLREQTDWNFFYFLFMLMSPVTLFLASAFALPDVKEETAIDMRAYYFDTARFFFPLLAASTMLDAIRRALQAGSLTDFGAVSNAISALLLLSLGVNRRSTYHTLVTLFVSGLFGFFLVRAAMKLA